MAYIYRLWGKSIHLETTIGDKPLVFSYNGNKHSRTFLFKTVLIAGDTNKQDYIGFVI